MVNYSQIFITKSLQFKIFIYLLPNSVVAAHVNQLCEMSSHVHRSVNRLSTVICVPVRRYR